MSRNTDHGTAIGSNRDRRRFSTIVADPPWDHSDGTGFSFGLRDPRGRSGKHEPSSHSIPYSIMTVDEIMALPVHELSCNDATLYLWTTNRYLRQSYDVVESWGFRPSTLLVWCKPANQGLFGGIYLSNLEFVLMAKKGEPRALGKEGSRWHTWPRGKHSEKHEAFFDMIERLHPPPYLELFARRNRLGWSTWGNECFEHVTLASHLNTVESNAAPRETLK